MATPGTTSCNNKRDPMDTWRQQRGGCPIRTSELSSFSSEINTRFRISRNLLHTQGSPNIANFCCPAPPTFDYTACVRLSLAEKAGRGGFPPPVEASDVGSGTRALGEQRAFTAASSWDKPWPGRGPAGLELSLRLPMPMVAQWQGLARSHLIDGWHLVIAERIVPPAQLIWRENIIASTGPGFGALLGGDTSTSAGGRPEIMPICAQSGPKRGGSP